MSIGKKLMMIMSSFLILTMGGCAKSNTIQVNVLATTDLHGMVPYSMAEYIKKERENDPNISLVDAGDFFDSDAGGPMDKYLYDRSKKDTILNELENKYVEFPLADDMSDVGYDAVVLGNHEFISNNRYHLDNMISDFEKHNIDVLSANTYKNNNENYVKPYTIKEIDTEDGVVRLGILGITIKEVGESKDFDEDGNLVEAESRELKDQYGYDGKLYMNDLVDEANKWSKIMKEEENSDVIVAVVHSGEKPKKPKNPGNRIQEIAQESEYIDAIVAGHTHKQFDQHDYKNKNNEDVIVTQPGKHGECISKIIFELENKKGSWNVVSKESKLTEFGKDIKIIRDNSNANGALGISGVGADYIIENIKGGKYKVNFYSKEYENGELVNEREIYNAILDENDKKLSVGIYQEDNIIRLFNNPSAIYSSFNDVTIDFFNDAPKGISFSAIEKEKILTIDEEVPIALFSLSDEDKEVSGLNIDDKYQLKLGEKDLVVFMKYELIK